MRQSSRLPLLCLCRSDCSLVPQLPRFVLPHKLTTTMLLGKCRWSLPGTHWMFEQLNVLCCTAGITERDLKGMGVADLITRKRMHAGMAETAA
eukprot:SAG22_NODE_1251_length_5005_cov_22.891154_8_plen_93_part_00